MSSFLQDMGKATELISLPDIYLKIRQLMDDPRSDIVDFADIVKVDPGLSSKVLKVVNSAYYGFSAPIENMMQAVNMIGIAQLHNMVLGVSAVSALDLPNDFVSLKSLWQSSLFCGVLSRQLAPEAGVRQGESLYIVGLLHDIGHLLLYAKFPDYAHKILRLVREEGATQQNAENQILGCHYGQIGELIMKSWNLSPGFQTLTRLQPTPLQATSEQKETALLHLSHGYAYQRYIDNDKFLDDLIQPEVWGLLNLSQDQVKGSLDVALEISADLEKVILS